MPEETVSLRIGLPQGVTDEEVKAAALGFAVEAGLDPDALAKAARPRKQHAVRALEDAENVFERELEGVVEIFRRRLAEHLGEHE